MSRDSVRLNRRDRGRPHDAVLMDRLVRGQYDPEFGAVVAALRMIGEKALRHVDPDRREVDTDNLIRDARRWSTGERLLTETAIALWRGTGTVDLGRLVTTLDDARFMAFAEALATRRGVDTWACAYGGRRVE